MYTFADGERAGESPPVFPRRQLRQVFGFTGDGDTGAPREIIPQTGDQFTMLERWMDLDPERQCHRTPPSRGRP